MPIKNYEFHDLAKYEVIGHKQHLNQVLLKYETFQLRSSLNRYIFTMFVIFRYVSKICVIFNFLQ